MSMVTYERFVTASQSIGLMTDEDPAFIEMVKDGKKYKKIIEQILKNREIDEEKLAQYINKMIKLDKKLGFVSYFLVMELPEEDIDRFDRSEWQSITKITKFPELSYEAKKGCLRLCGIYGIFEQDINAPERISSLKNLLKRLTSEDLCLCSKLKMDFDPEFLKFFEENRDKLDQEEMAIIQDNWNKIKTHVEIKSLDNINRFLEIINNKDSINSFELYMRANNIPEEIQQKYRVIYEQMCKNINTNM